MALQLPAAYKPPLTTSSDPTFVVNLPSRGIPCASKSSKAGAIRYTSKGHRVRIKLPPSPSPATAQWSLDTPEQDEDDVDDPSFVGSENEYSSDDEDCWQSSDGDTEEVSGDGDNISDSDEELSDEDSEESSSDDGEEFVDKIPEDEVEGIFLEAKQLSLLIPIPHIVAAGFPGIVAAEWANNEGKRMTRANAVKEGKTMGKRDDPPPASTPAPSRKPLPSAFKNASPIATTLASQATPGRGTTLNFTVPRNGNLGSALQKCFSMSLSNNLLFNEVFKIQAIDGESHPCRGIGAQGSQCKSNVPKGNSFSIKFVESSLEFVDGIKDIGIQSLAMYNMCDAHTKQSAKLANEWVRLAKLTEATRKYWQDQQKSLSVEPQALRKTYAEFAAAEVRRMLAQDEIAVRAEKEKIELYDESQKTITQLRTKIDNMESKALSVEQPNQSSTKSFTEYLGEISALEKQINNLTTENSSLKEAQKSTEDALAKERERNQRALLDAKDLYKISHKTAEALRKDVDALNSRIGELTTKESSLKNSLESTQDALDKEKVRSRELEIRLEERVVLRTKTQDSTETKLEKYLREELDKSQRHVLQQQKDFEKLRDDHVRLEITNVTLESKAKQMEATREELSRTSKREFQELAERNSDLSNQLNYTKTQFEQLKAALLVMEKENEGEAPKSKFNLRGFHRRLKHEPSRPLVPPTDH